MTSSIAVARAILTAAIPGVKNGTKVPNPIPLRFFRISRVGGVDTYELDRPLILVECLASTSQRAPDDPQAEQDAKSCYLAFKAAADGGPWADGWVTGWDGGNIVQFPDPEQPSHARWQFTGTLFILNQ